MFKSFMTVKPRSRRGRDRMGVGFSLVVSSNPARCEVYSIQHQGRIQKGGGGGARPLKLGKI